MEISPAHTLNLTGVLSTSKRILRSNYYHFLALSLFFLPLSISLITTPSRYLSGHFHKFPPNHHNAVISHLLYPIIIYVSTLCAVATITYSTYHGFEGNQVNFSTALKSLAFSFFPVITTAIVAHVLLFLISITFLLNVGVILTLVQSLGFTIDYNSIYFMSMVGATLIVIIVYFHLNWSLAFVVVVAESKWGLTPLIRSSYLVKGMRSVSLLLLMYFGIFTGLFVFLFSDTLYRPGVSGQGFTGFMMLGTFFVMMIFLRSSAASTVLYMYCKALHGELAIEIAEGFDYDYINLPSDVEKVPQIVPVVAA